MERQLLNITLAVDWEIKQSKQTNKQRKTNFQKRKFSVFTALKIVVKGGKTGTNG